MRADVVVIGAGVIGASIALHVRRRGARVVICDPRPAQAPSASWASAGGVRRQLRDPREWALALEAARRWPELAGELGADCGFRAGGHLHLAETDAQLDQLREEAVRESAAGLEVEVLDAKATAEAAAVLAPAAGALFTRGDGQADPRRTTRAFLDAAVRAGAEHLEVAVDGFQTAPGGRVSGVLAGGVEIRTETVVLVAGSWTPALAQRLGLDLPLRVEGLQMLRSRPAGPEHPALGPTVSAEGRRLSLKQLSDRSYLVGGGWPAQVDLAEHRCRVREDSVGGSWATASAVLPELGRLGVAGSHCGLESFSYDGAPLIGRLPHAPGLYLAAGFSGHGFQLSPAVGEAVAADLAGEPAPALAALPAGRVPRRE